MPYRDHPSSGRAPQESALIRYLTVPDGAPVPAVPTRGGCERTHPDLGTRPMLWRTPMIVPHDGVISLGQIRRASVRGNSLHEQQMAAGSAGPAVRACHVRRRLVAGQRRRPALAGCGLAGRWLGRSRAERRATAVGASAGRTLGSSGGGTTASPRPDGRPGPASGGTRPLAGAVTQGPGCQPVRPGVEPERGRVRRGRRPRVVPVPGRGTVGQA